MRRRSSDNAGGLPAWKAMARMLAALHRVYGAGIVTLEGRFAAFEPEDLVLVNTTPEEYIHVRRGPIIHPVDVRRFMWQEVERNPEAFRRSGSVVWSVLDGRHGEWDSFISAGVLVTAEEASGMGSVAVEFPHA